MHAPRAAPVQARRPAALTEACDASQVLRSIGVLLAQMQSLGSAGGAPESWAEPLLDVVCNAYLPRRAEARPVPTPTDAFAGNAAADQQMAGALIAVVIAHMDQQRWPLPPNPLALSMPRRQALRSGRVPSLPAQCSPRAPVPA
jgi:hypothetical protein